MKRIAVLTPLDAREGFRLAGSDQVSIPSEQASSALAELVDNRELGLIIVDERLLEAIPEPFLRQQERRFDGVIVVLPAPAETGAEAEAYALDLIKRAVGYHVRLSR